MALKDTNTDTVLDEQDLNVSSSSDDKLVFAVGDLTNAVDDPPRLIIFDEPDDEVPDGKVALYVMNLETPHLLLAHIASVSTVHRFKAD
ncbi:hypothetical protein AB4254_19940 [Vibrio breoganii]